jgi:uncharacterized protein (TIGR00288 family)
MVLESVKDSVEKIRKRFMEKPKLAFFIDGPNMIRKEFNIDLRDLRKRVGKYGRMVIGKVFLNQFASEKLIEAVANEGLEAIIALGDPELKTDVDVSIAVHAMEAIYDPNISIIALATRDADFLPLIQQAKKMGKITVLIAVQPGLAISLRHAADHVEIIK